MTECDRWVDTIWTPDFSRSVDTVTTKQIGPVTVLLLYEGFLELSEEMVLISKRAEYANASVRTKSSVP